MATSDDAFNLAVRMGFVLDVAGYSARSANQKVDVQQRLAILVRDVLRDLGLELSDTYHHGTGDGMVVFLPAHVEVHRALARLIRSTADGLAVDNGRYRDRMRIRMAVVIGPLGPAAIGFSGNTIVEAARMVDSPVLREALADSPVDLVVLVSDQLHAYVVGERHPGLDASEFQPVDVRTKEFQATAWLWTGPVPRSSTSGGPVRFELAPPHASPCLIGILTGRIRRVRGVDIWVNSENTDMEMPRFNDFSVSSIIRYHGSRRDQGGRVIVDVIADELAAAVGGRRPVAPGTAFVTGAGALTDTNDVRWIVHVAAVHGEPGAGFRQVRDIGACVTNALIEADRLAHGDESIRTILFPLLGTGVGGGSVTGTATAMVESAVDYLLSTPETRLRVVSLLGYAEAERAALERALTQNPRLRAVSREIPA